MTPVKRLGTQKQLVMSSGGPQQEAREGEHLRGRSGGDRRGAPLALRIAVVAAMAQRSSQSAQRRTRRTRGGTERVPCVPR